MGTKFQSWEIKNVLWMDGGDGCTALGMYITPLNYPLKNG